VGERKTIDELLASARARIERLQPSEALAAMSAGALLVDIRSEVDRARDGVIPGAMFHPRSVLEWRMDPASGYDDPAVGGVERQVILVCAEGYQSSLAAANLRELGFLRAGDVAGGFEAWAAEGLPVEQLDVVSP
jgi:rhodanese-related sulfurtransferase